MVGRSGFFTAFRMTGGAALRLNSAQGRPRAVHDCYVYILANESHKLYVESEEPRWVVLSAGWPDALDSSLRSE